MEQADLLNWRADATISGPRSAASDGPARKATSVERWCAFADAHPAIAKAMLNRAQYTDGRVSAKALVEWARATFRASINNSATAGLATWLATMDPTLADRIETRRRKA